jgi:hypothetical protein
LLAFDEELMLGLDGTQGPCDDQSETS